MDTFDDSLAFVKFGVGQPVTRKEDPILLRGEGRYTDDINLPGQAYAVMVRSRNAHGMLKGIDTSEAKGLPGVLMILTARRSRRGGLRPADVPAQHPAARRHADEDTAALVAGQGQGSLRG